METIFTVVIPTYNRWPYVRDAITSVLAQSLPDVECVVVDDGSTDATADLIRREFPSVVVVQQANSERGAARNNGARVAKGRYITFLDSDDRYAEHHLERAARLLADGARAVASPAKMWNPATGATWSLGQRSPRRRLNVADIAWLNPVAAGSALSLHRTLFDEVGGFPSDRRVAGSEDWVFTLKVASRTPIVELSEATTFIRDHPGRSMADPELMIASRLAALDELVRGTDSAKQVPAEVRRLAAASTYRFCAANRYHAGDMKGARADLSRVRQHLGTRAAATSSGRLWLQTFLGPSASRRLRSARDLVRRRT